MEAGFARYAQAEYNALHTLFRGVYDPQVHPDVEYMTYNILNKMEAKCTNGYYLGLNVAREEKRQLEEVRI